MLRTTEKQGSCFIRTDQLDGETDWKLRVAVPSTQQLDSDADIFNLNMEVYAEKPQRDINGFLGTFKIVSWAKYISLKSVLSVVTDNRVAFSLMTQPFKKGRWT